MTESTTKVETIKLIDGTYSARDAAEIMYAVLDDKIKFHNIQINSYMERNQGELEHSRQRLAELKKERARIALIIKEAEENQLKLKLSSHIKVDFH